VELSKNFIFCVSGSLNALFETVEKSLISLEKLIDTRAFQDRQLDHRFQLALYKENKLSQLEATRGEGTFLL